MRSLEALRTAGNAFEGTWEVVIVDNGSTDDTVNILSKNPPDGLPIRLVQEPRPGASHARNAGIAAASGRLIAQTDDDCLVAPDWLTRISAAWIHHPDAGTIGGRIELADPADLKISLRTGTEPIAIDTTYSALHNLGGCNLSFRRDTLVSIGCFDPRFGPGTASGSAEDLDIYHRLIKARYKLYYEPSILVLHAHGRRDHGTLSALRHIYTVSRGAFYAKHILNGDIACTRDALSEMTELVRRRQWRALSHLLEGAWIWALRK